MTVLFCFYGIMLHCNTGMKKRSGALADNLSIQDQRWQIHECHECDEYIACPKKSFFRKKDG